MAAIPWLDMDSVAFPALRQAMRRPNGLLAIGGDLRPQRLLAAYSQGIFPWYEDPQPILWWSPDPRAVLFPERLHLPSSLRKELRRKRFTISVDGCFEQVLAACAAPRSYAAGTWIGREMHTAYCELHRLGHAHSIEAWRDGELVGGLYGVALGRVFFGESMFHTVRDASKVALVHLAGQLLEWGFALIDCQQDTPHMRQLGAETISRDRFRGILDHNIHLPGPVSPWQLCWNYGDDAWATQ